ncbi:MAG: Na/Pi cotransporter family protein [Oscillospiraceae bacterium]|nr:Na/Pi cotransporter family protein [Oscillospiraceae bacterium]
MNIFNLISLLGGLAMFLYGMRMMGDGLKESSSGTLKRAMEKLTNTPVKAFLSGLVLTAVIQSSTATIVITSGLVGAGIITLHQSLGIVVGANVGTTVTGQIIRLLDVDASGTSILQLFKPSTLAPLALIIGVVIIMGFKFNGSETVGKIAIGFGILFSGLMGMTDAVGSLTESGIIEQLFARLGENPIIGYAIGLGVSFVLQSSSATIGILQAFSTSGALTFSAIYAVLLGIYLGDCVTTAIVINIGAKNDAKRVGYMNILFNLGKTLVVLIGVTVVHQLGLIDGMWNATIRSGGIANTNTVFNLASAVILFPFLNIFEKLSYQLVKEEKEDENTRNEYTKVLDTLNPVFFSTPALAFGSCYNVLTKMFEMAEANLNHAFDVVAKFDQNLVDDITAREDDIDQMADEVSNYLVQLSAFISAPDHIEIMDHYYNVITEFERLGDHATNIAEMAVDLKKSDRAFSETALSELETIRELLTAILSYSKDAFEKRSVEAARHIEPLEEVVDDMVHVLKDNHLERLRKGNCSITAGTAFLNFLSDIERISDICSNIGVATIVRVHPELKHEVHNYMSTLHAGKDETFNQEYKAAHDQYFAKL